MKRFFIPILFFLIINTVSSQSYPKPWSNWVSKGYGLQLRTRQLGQQQNPIYTRWEIQWKKSKDVCGLNVIYNAEILEFGRTYPTVRGLSGCAYESSQLAILEFVNIGGASGVLNSISFKPEGNSSPNSNRNNSSNSNQSYNTTSLNSNSSTNNNSYNTNSSSYNTSSSYTPSSAEVEAFGAVIKGIGSLFTKKNKKPKKPKNPSTNSSTEYSVSAMYNKGRSYYNSKNYKEAIYWLEKAADQGYANAQVYVGYMYGKGEGVNKNDKKAVSWYRKAAERGNRVAQSNLGLKYYYGEGVDEDDMIAANWFKKSAIQGFPKAQYWLGYMYEEGEGVDKDLINAKYWYKKSCENDYENACENLKELKSSISSSSTTKRMGELSMLATPFTAYTLTQKPLRSESSLDSKEVYLCPENSKVEVLDNSQKIWYKVRLNGHTGYMSKYNLKTK